METVFVQRLLLHAILFIVKNFASDAAMRRLSQTARFNTWLPFSARTALCLSALPLLLSTLTGCTPNATTGGGGNSAVAAGLVQNAASQSGEPGLRFVDVAEKAGINYRWEIPGKRPLTILQTIGNGCAFLDFNNDNKLDILLVGARVALYKGDGQGHFTNVSDRAGVAKLKGHFLGCAVGDYDGDGFPDVYLTAYRGGALLHNDAGKAFSDRTSQAHIPVQPWATSAAWADVDTNGTLDLFVGNYVDFGPQTVPQLCDQQNLMTSCGPRHYKAEKNALYLNDGKGGFKSATTAWNVGTSTGKALGAAFAPLDTTAPRPSLYLSNDEMPGDLMQNDGKKFTNVGAESGTAYDLNGNVHGGMGVDFGDYDNDGSLDLFVSTYQQESKCIYHNDGKMLFSEQSPRLGLETPTAPWVAFGVKWADFDNDGWLDLAIANGHVQDNIGKIDQTVKGSVYKQTAQILRSENGARFIDVSAQAGPDMAKTIVGRGLSVGDYDNDGRVDVLIVDAEGQPLLLHNETSTATKSGNWAGLRLAGKGAEGALVTVEAGAHKWTRLCTTGGSYMSASDARVNIGVGDAQTIKQVTVRWAGGKTQTWNDVPVNHYTTLTRK